ncbi:DNA-binding anti-repressor SinI [Heyndrickxia oleronia]|uniref:DNA-binding anti-repressor SinI n=1 Tax=Heyndrickxia oleronia TaxID=38875 RepID=UPI003750A61E
MEQMDDKEKKQRQNDQLDNEWVEMMKRAKCMGLSVQEVHAFLQEKKKISIH